MRLLGPRPEIDKEGLVGPPQGPLVTGDEDLVGPPRPQAAMDDEDMVGPPRPSNDEDEDDEEDDDEDEVDEDEYRVPLSNEILLKGHTKACNPRFLEPRGWSTDVQMYEQVFVHVVLCNFLKCTITIRSFYFCMLIKSLASMKGIFKSND